MEIASAIFHQSIYSIRLYALFRIPSSFSNSLFAQNSLRFHLKDSNQQDLPFASAFLKKLPDSTLYKGF